VEKCVTDGQAIDGNIIRRMRFACWITKATDTHAEYVILICISTATMVSRMHLNMTFIHTCTLPVLSFLWRNSQIVPVPTHC
jgi:hypothetical protein